MITYMRIFAGALIVLSTAGCGQEMLAGGMRSGEASAVVTDDPGTSSSTSSIETRAARMNLTPTGGISAATAAASGSILVEGSVALESAGGQTIILGDGPGAASVQIGSAALSKLAASEVEVGRYINARVTFTRVEADVSGGLIVGVGVAVTGKVTVLLPQPLVIEAPIELLVREDGEHTVIIDLNSEVWLAAVDPLLLTVPTQAFAAAVTIR